MRWANACMHAVHEGDTLFVCDCDCLMVSDLMQAMMMQAMMMQAMMMQAMMMQAMHA
jgi:hypothetical protein